jgi:hypothetical protein
MMSCLPGVNATGPCEVMAHVRARTERWPDSRAPFSAAQTRPAPGRHPRSQGSATLTTLASTFACPSGIGEGPRSIDRWTPTRIAWRGARGSGDLACLPGAVGTGDPPPRPPTGTPTRIAPAVGYGLSGRGESNAAWPVEVAEQETIAGRAESHLSRLRPRRVWWSSRRTSRPRRRSCDRRSGRSVDLSGLARARHVGSR